MEEDAKMVHVLIIDSTSKSTSNLEKKITAVQSILSIHVASETEGLKWVAKYAFDLVIHRVAMPAMGANLNLKERHPETPLFVVPTFSYDEEGRDEEESHIVQDIIPKIIQRQFQQTLSPQE